uniref:Uncharacterized protein n=1 Tax=Anguilla anguilla TaxID=7936 RepID=A0A0E9VAN0_ANGAN
MTHRKPRHVLFTRFHVCFF